MSCFQMVWNMDKIALDSWKFKFRSEQRVRILNVSHGYNRTKLGRITRPRPAISQKLAASGIMCVSTYEKVVGVTRLEPKLNSYILEEY